MKSFKSYYNEQNSAAAGGVFGSWTSVGGAFPASGDAGYNPGDARQLNVYGPAAATLGAKVDKKKNKIKRKIFRRNLNQNL